MTFHQRLKPLADNHDLLRGIRRGIEKESLRINPDGHLATTAHPPGLGSALTHPSITTDYSEALLEFITPVCATIPEALQRLEEIHRFAYSQIGAELLWCASMPCLLEGDEGIPIARYGSSNIATMKQVYREGLGYRYGRLMQTIAGIHYNFSMPENYWPAAQAAAAAPESAVDFRTGAYFSLIRNFRRYCWLLVYLFGSSPAVCASFLRGNDNHRLTPFDGRNRTLHAAYGTSLRMGDLGYQSSAQKHLNICYNTLDDYVETLHRAITTPHPDYQRIGTVTNGHHLQLNTALLQIENEFYSAIRPKRVTRSGETPLGALCRDGVEYIEVRCVDVNPMLALGIDAEQIRFLDTFLLYCLLEDSPVCDDAETAAIVHNLDTVVYRGREPGLSLRAPGGELRLTDWSAQLLDRLQPVAELLDTAHGGGDYVETLDAQAAKVSDPGKTPAARVLSEMASADVPFFRLAMDYSTRWAEYFRGKKLSPGVMASYRETAAQSLEQQRQIEAADAVDFDTFLAAYYRQYGELPH